MSHGGSSSPLIAIGSLLGRRGNSQPKGDNLHEGLSSFPKFVVQLIEQNVGQEPTMERNDIDSHRLPGG